MKSGVSNDYATLKGLNKIIAHFYPAHSMVSSDLFPGNIIVQAFGLVKDVDVDDLPIVAASLFTKSILFTGDKKLYKGLKQKNFEAVYNNEELRELLQL